MLIHNALITGSLLINGTGHNTGSFSGSFTGAVAGTTATSSYVEYSNVANKPALVSGSAQVASFGYATTGSNQFNGNQAITGSLTTTGQIIAQTLNVQQVTSSIVYSSGSNIFGNSLANIQQFTGSLQVTGSTHYLMGNIGIGATSPYTAANYIFTTTNGTNGSGYVTQTNGTLSALVYSNASATTISEQRALPLILCIIIGCRKDNRNKLLVSMQEYNS